MEDALFKSRIRLRHLDCFVAVTQTRNLGKAAAKLRLTQPAVSKTLSELEEIVGVQLLERNRLGAQLTREGEAFLAHAITVLEALDAAKAAVDSRHAPQSETVHVGALPTVACDLLPDALIEFRRRHPHARVTIQTAANTALLHMLKAGEIDFALARMADPEMMAGLSFEMLYVEPLVLAVRPGHPLIDAGGTDLSEVAAYPLVVSPQGTIPRHHAESYFRSRGLKIPFNCIETMSVSLARQLARQSDAVWITPAGAVRADLAEGMLVRLKCRTEGTEEPVGLMHRSEGAPASVVPTLMEVLRAMAVKCRLT